ncbi:hypothetical protein LCGC14_0224230 [marine sediment metagenome]|uniref:Uncharacterized protein n=1 Tax=marine sediment metagenome TaxID=412755 RepID=A0A0F9UCE0_9ZZZZ
MVKTEVIKITILKEWIEEMKIKFDPKSFDGSGYDKLYGVKLCLTYLDEFVEKIEKGE